MGMADRYDLAKRLKRMATAHLPMQAGDPDWGTVMLFYSALHVTTAYMESIGVGAPATHVLLKAAVAGRPELGSRFEKAYGALKHFGWNVRYSPGFTMSPANLRLASDRFRIVTVFVEPTIRAAIGLQPGSDLWP
jgi:hypothetical protein